MFFYTWTRFMTRSFCSFLFLTFFDIWHGTCATVQAHWLKTRQMLVLQYLPIAFTVSTWKNITQWCIAVNAVTSTMGAGRWDDVSGRRGNTPKTRSVIASAATGGPQGRIHWQGRARWCVFKNGRGNLKNPRDTSECSLIRYYNDIWILRIHLWWIWM